MMISIQKLTLLGAALLLFPAISQANLIVNGGFENAPLQGSGNDPKGVHFGGTAYYANSVPVTSLNGWTFGYDGTLDNYGGTAEVEWYSTDLKKTWNATPAEGHFALELDSDAFRGRIYAQASLTEALTLGQTYQLTFSLAPEYNVASPSAISLGVEIQGKQYTFSVPSSQNGALAWTQETVSFVANSTNPEIRFYDGVYNPDVNTNFYNDVNLDNVNLIPPPEAPEPSSVLALTALLALMGGQWGWNKARAHRQPC